MSRNRRIGTAVATGTLILALGAGPLTDVTAMAEPLPVPVAPQGPSFPDPGAPGGGAQPKKDERVEKAEALGGGIITKMIDSSAETLRCTLNIALPTVKCK
ncbi:hypothetical protein ACFV4K_26035 [Nocardia sp. NPDC059764]|uniref:hypothetical protein n=1 Tax=Nocardia sp. NPDC059764 TaxID=3346939 RepID=UPI003662DD3A